MIEIKNLQFGYKKNRLLFDNLDLKLEAGQIHGLFGKNGAGKTTLLKHITGLRFAKHGSVTVNGFSTFKREPDFLKQVFIVPEEFEFPQVDIKTFVKLHSPFYPLFDKELFESCMSEFEIDLKGKLHQLSLGQKKKVMLSFGLATNTQILIMDEPTNGLDIPSKSVFRKIVANALTPDKLFIISTHQVRDLECLIDSVVMVNDGKIVFNQSIEAIAEKIYFGKIDTAVESSDVLYKEENIAGTFGMLKNTQNIDSRVDLEVLFNGVISNQMGFRNYFNN